MVSAWGKHTEHIFYASASQALWDWCRSPGIRYPWRLLTYAVLGISSRGAVVVLMKQITSLSTCGRGMHHGCGVNAKWFLDGLLSINQLKAMNRRKIFDMGFKISDEYLPPDFVRPKNLQKAHAKHSHYLANTARIQK
jgi:hypothetical protein